MIYGIDGMPVFPYVEEEMENERLAYSVACCVEQYWSTEAESLLALCENLRAASHLNNITKFVDDMALSLFEGYQPKPSGLSVHVQHHNFTLEDPYIQLAGNLVKTLSGRKIAFVGDFAAFLYGDKVNPGGLQLLHHDLEDEDITMFETSAVGIQLLDIARFSLILSEKGWTPSALLDHPIVLRIGNISLPRS